MQQHGRLVRGGDPVTGLFHFLGLALHRLANHRRCTPSTPALALTESCLLPAAASFGPSQPVRTRLYVAPLPSASR